MQESKIAAPDGKMKNRDQSREGSAPIQQRSNRGGPAAIVLHSHPLHPDIGRGLALPELTNLAELGFGEGGTWYWLAAMSAIRFQADISQHHRARLGCADTVAKVFWRL